MFLPYNADAVSSAAVGEHPELDAVDGVVRTQDQLVSASIVAEDHFSLTV